MGSSVLNVFKSFDGSMGSFIHCDKGSSTPGGGGRSTSSSPQMAHATAVIELLGREVVSIAQCIAIDADVFPYPSGDFTQRSWRDRIWVAREPGPGRVVGFLAARARRGILYIQGLAVDTAARQRGVGR